jgi:hypothetical protein
VGKAEGAEIGSINSKMKRETALKGGQLFDTSKFCWCKGNTKARAVPTQNWGALGCISRMCIFTLTCVLLSYTEA